MNVYLQHCRTKEYVCSLDKWTAVENQAMVFENTSDAITFARDHLLEELQLVVVYKATGNRIVLPLPRRDQG